jgi:carbon monoxide dehydrogenase subunit G
MGTTNATGRQIRVSRPASELFAIFSDLTNFTRGLPQDQLVKADVVATSESIRGKLQGMEIGIKIGERIPFTLVKYESFGPSPVPFRIYVRIEDAGALQSLFNLEIEAELSGMFKMMLGGKLQEAVDQLTDRLEAALGFK